MKGLPEEIKKEICEFLENESFEKLSLLNKTYYWGNREKCKTKFWYNFEQKLETILEEESEIILLKRKKNF